MPINENTVYSKCKCCDHFIEENSMADDYVEVSRDDKSITVKPTQHGPTKTFARYVHLDDGEQEYDHDAEPGESDTLKGWKEKRSELFIEYPDGNDGPNSEYYSQRGKRNSHLYEDSDVLFLDNDGKVVQWQSKGDHSGPVNSGETVEEFGIGGMSDIERYRVGVK